MCGTSLHRAGGPASLLWVSELTSKFCESHPLVRVEIVSDQPEKLLGISRITKLTLHSCPPIRNFTESGLTWFSVSSSNLAAY